jgi:Fe-S oxidoreductase
MVKRLFAPGCALILYKPRLVDRVEAALAADFGPVERLTTCCRNIPALTPGTEVINVCPGCDRRYRRNYAHATTVSLWEVLAGSASFDFPDYRGRSMTILDACPTRDQPRVHEAVRDLLRKMNIGLREPKHTRTHGICCGDSAFGEVPTERVKKMMRKRASQMPVEEVVVYCVSCAKSMFIGGRRPRYLVDLLFGEETLRGTVEPDDWHAQLDAFIAAH